MSAFRVILRVLLPLARANVKEQSGKQGMVFVTSDLRASSLETTPTTKHRHLQTRKSLIVSGSLDDSSKRIMDVVALDKQQSPDERFVAVSIRPAYAR